MLELSLRLYQAADPGFIITPDTAYLRYRGRPCSEEFNGFRLNSRGYKDLEFSEQKRPGRYRIVAIVDSQTYGAVPYGDSYMTLVERMLQSIHRETEIFNLGIPQAGPMDYLSVLADEGFSLNPDMVLLHFNIFDDFKKRRNTSQALFIFSCSIMGYWLHRPCRCHYPGRSPDLFLSSEKSMGALNASEDDFDFTIPNRMLGAELVKSGIPCLDLIDFFLMDTQKTGKAVTQGNDPHWNRYGSRLAAKAVSPWLAGRVRLSAPTLR